MTDASVSPLCLNMASLAGPWYATVGYLLCAVCGPNCYGCWLFLYPTLTVISERLGLILGKIDHVETADPR